MGYFVSSPTFDRTPRYAPGGYAPHTTFSVRHINGPYKGCGMGPWLVLVSPCFRENVDATCKIGFSFV